jgi:hypothetical protein
MHPAFTTPDSLGMLACLLVSVKAFVDKFCNYSPPPPAPLPLLGEGGNLEVFGVFCCRFAAQNTPKTLVSPPLPRFTGERGLGGEGG